MWSRCWSTDCPAAHGEDHGEAGCAPAVEQIPTLQSMEDPTPEQSRWMHPRKAVTLGRPHWSRLL